MSQLTTYELNDRHKIKIVKYYVDNHSFTTISTKETVIRNYLRVMYYMHSNISHNVECVSTLYEHIVYKVY